MNRLILRADMILQGKELAPVEKGALVVENWTYMRYISTARPGRSSH